MCSRYVPPPPEDISRVYHAKLAFQFGGVFKAVIYPGYQAPVVLESSGERVVESRFWGFVYRMPSKKSPGQLLEKIAQNAVSETVAEKRTFKGAWESGRRCVIPALNFMEPRDGVFVPITDPQLPMLAIAGIWGPTTRKGQEHAAFTMLTCEPNAFVSGFHDRMPVILRPEDVDEWLSPDTPPDQAHALCRPY